MPVVEIHPVPALAYAPGLDLDRVTAPPYDVIPPPLLERLRADARNFVHVTLPRGEGDARYAAAAATLRRFEADGVLARRPPAYYAYSITYASAEGPRTAHGFFAMLRLDAAYRDVKPHERTHRGPKEDRLRLYRATEADTEPIQLLVPDADDAVRLLLATATERGRAPPLMRCVDHEGSEHRVWAVPDAEGEALARAVAAQPLYIADGHHRYETACAYAKERGPGPWERKLVALFPASDPGLSIHPTHRLLRGLEDVAAAVRRVERFLPERHPVPTGDAALAARRLLGWVQSAQRRGHAFGVLAPDAFRVVVLASNRVPADALPPRSAAWRGLDVAVLHHHVLPQAFGVTDENAEAHLAYTRVAAEAVEAVRSGEAQAAVLMNPTRVADVLRVADAGEVMPQKSTYFMPKLRSGLLCVPFRP